MKYLSWLLKAVIFFVLFAFALNNQAPVEVHFFFGKSWQAPMVLVVLTAWVVGVFAGIVAMLPLWLSARKQAKALADASTATPTTPEVFAPPPHRARSHGT